MKQSCSNGLGHFVRDTGSNTLRSLEIERLCSSRCFFIRNASRGMLRALIPWLLVRSSAECSDSWLQGFAAHDCHGSKGQTYSRYAFGPQRRHLQGILKGIHPMTFHWKGKIWATSLCVGFAPTCRSLQMAVCVSGQLQLPEHVHFCRKMLICVCSHIFPAQSQGMGQPMAILSLECALPAAEVRLTTVQASIVTSPSLCKAVIACHS